MEQNSSATNLWTYAGKAGLALGAISSVYHFASYLLAGDLSPATLGQEIIGMVLWAIKFAGCIWVLSFFMKKFASENSGVDKRTAFKMGTASSLLSALMFAAIYLADMLYISPDFYHMIYQEAYTQIIPVLDSNGLEALDRIMPKIPQITFFTTLIYCFIFGTVLSLILSRNIQSQKTPTEFNL